MVPGIVDDVYVANIEQEE